MKIGIVGESPSQAIVDHLLLAGHAVEMGQAVEYLGENGLHQFPEVAEFTEAAEPEKLSRKAQLRRARQQHRFIYSHPGFRGHRLYIGSQFRLQPKRLESEPILDDEGEPLPYHRRAIGLGEANLYQVHQGRGEIARRHRQIRSGMISIDQLHLSKSKRVLPRQ